MIVYDLHIKEKDDTRRIKVAKLTLTGPRNVHHEYKSYKNAGGCVREHSQWESGSCTIWRNKGNKLRISSYYDGCFYPIYYTIDKIEVIEEYGGKD